MKRKLITRIALGILGAAALAGMLFVWLWIPFGGRGSDQAKYRNLETYGRRGAFLKSVKNFVPSRVYAMARLPQLEIKTQADYGRNVHELLASGYLVEAPITVTNLAGRASELHKLLKQTLPKDSHWLARFNVYSNTVLVICRPQYADACRKALGGAPDPDSPVQDLQTHPTPRLTADNKQIRLGVSIRWQIADTATYTLKFPGDAGAASRRELEQTAARAEVNAVGLYNLADIYRGNAPRLAELEKRMQTSVQTDLDRNRCGMRIVSLTINSVVPL